MVTEIIENALLIYTDGSLKPKGRKGGYGIVFIYVDDIGNETIIDEISPPGIRGTTNNRMELQACIEALKSSHRQVCFQEVYKIIIRTDSKYVKDNKFNALGIWRSSGWKNRFGRPIDNTDLWKEFVREYNKIHKRIDIQWVKGHGKGKLKDEYNYIVDDLATESALNPLSKRVYRSSVRRKFGNKKTIKGSITVSGQIVKIYVIEIERLREQKMWKYRYQIASIESPDYQCIDFIYSNEHMRDGRFYEVQLNNDMKFPQILSVIQELNKIEMKEIMGAGQK